MLAGKAHGEDDAVAVDQYTPHMKAETAVVRLLRGDECFTKRRVCRKSYCRGCHGQVSEARLGPSAATVLLKHTTSTIISVVTDLGLLERPLPTFSSDLAESAPDDWAPRIRAGDSRAFEALYLALYSPLCAYVAAIIGNTAHSEDLVQDLLCWVWERRATWQPTSGGVRRYLFGAARNRALNYLKRCRIEDKASGCFPDFSETPSPLTDAEAADFSSALARALSDLAPRCRQACVLRWRYGLTYPEIADAMSVTQKAVEALLTRGLKALRVALGSFDM